MSDDGKPFANHVRSLYEYIYEYIINNNTSYKQATNLYHYFQGFNKGDIMMALVWPKRFSLRQAINFMLIVLGHSQSLHKLEKIHIS